MLYILYTPILKTSKFWSLEHVVNFTLIPKLWILRHVVHVTHAPTLTLQFFEIGACFILYTCPTLILQILELGACCILYTVHAQPKTSWLHSLKTYGVLSMWCIFYTCPTLVPSKILEFGECCIFTILVIKISDFEACCIFYTCLALLLQIYNYTCSTRPSKDLELGVNYSTILNNLGLN